MRATGLCGLLLVLALPGCSDNTAANDSVKAPTGPFHATTPAVAKVVTAAVNGDTSSPGVSGPPHVDCSRATAADSISGHAGINCDIAYAIKEPAGIDSDAELVAPTAGIWKALFADPGFQAGFIRVDGPITTVGGKSRSAGLFSISCDRKAAREIDWDNVDGKGLRTLCTYVPLAKGVPGA